MSDQPTKTVVIEPDVHAAVKVLSALYGKPIQEIVNEAIRAQYPVDELGNIDEAIIGDDGAPAAKVENLSSQDLEPE